MTGPTGEDLIRAIVGAAPEVDPPPESVEPIDHRLASYTLNDYGNARRLLDRFGDDLIWVESIGWYGWTGRVWSQEIGGRLAQTSAHRTAMAVYREAKALGIAGPSRDETPEEWDKRVAVHRRFASTSGNSGRIAGMLKEAQPYRAHVVDDLDADPLLLNVRNGTLVFDARSDAERAQAGAEGDRVSFRPHRRGDLITHMAEVDFDPEATCPAFLKFLAEAQPDPFQRVYLQRWFGYTLTGLQRDQKVTCLSGIGSNGKSTLVETLEALFGDYSMRLPFESLLRDDRRTGSQATPDLANLPGRRLVVAAEPEVGAVLSTAVVKKLTERESMQVRHLNQNFFEFVPQHHVTLMFNDPPIVKAQDDGTWRRISLVPWPVRFIDPSERDLHPDAPLKDYTLPERLLRELPGILNWALDGLRMYLEQGLDPPETIRSATQAYRAENDPVGQFILIAVERFPNTSIQGRDLYHAYSKWCEASGLSPWSNAAFGRQAKRQLRAETRGVVRYLDVRFKPDFLQAVPL